MSPLRPARRDAGAAHADVVVIGGANVDVKCRTDGRAVPRTSNPGRSTTAPGGVARNVAENLARLGVRVALVSAVGNDANGDALLAATCEAGVDVSGVVRCDLPTGTYTAVLDSGGELVIAVAAMSAMDTITPRVVRERRAAIARARILVLDCNLGAETLACALDIGHDAALRVVVDPVSVPKSARLRAVIRASRPIFTVTPNADELAALAGTHGDEDCSTLIAALHARGAERVWLRLGAGGSVLSTHDTHATGERIAAQEATVVDVTGAGDAMLAGYVYALLRDEAADVAVHYGHAAAALTVASDRTVSPAMTADALERAVLHRGAYQ